MGSNNINIGDKKYGAQTDYMFSLDTIMQNTKESIELIEQRNTTFGVQKE